MGSTLVQAWPRPGIPLTPQGAHPHCSQQSLLHPSPCTRVIAERPWSLLRAQGAVRLSQGAGPGWAERSAVFSSHQPRGRAGAQDGEALPMGALLTGPGAPLPCPSPPPVPPLLGGQQQTEKAQRCPSLCFSPGLDLPSAESDQVLGEAAAALQLSGGSCAGQAGD